VKGRLAFTGFNLLLWAAIALSLVAVGWALVTNTRRRESLKA